MLVRTLTIGAAILIAALPAAAQERGTVEFGAFISHNTFDSDYQMNNAIGGGGRIGIFLAPRWSLEFEGNGGSAGRPSPFEDRSFRFLDGRVVVVPVKVARASLLLGVGVGHADAHVDEGFDGQSYGYHLLVGGKLPVTENSALRLDLTQYFNGGARHRSIKAGLSLYRNPKGKETTVYQTVAAAPMAPMVHSDSVSAAETRRLRAEAAAYAALRDSLARIPLAAMTPSNVAALATMLEMVHFEHESSELDAVAKAILDDKVVIFNANPEMRIIITGYASSPGTDAYNMALGFRRATASKAYLVSRGVVANRIEITTRGENNLLVQGPSEVANAENRRGQFRLLIADPYLVKP